MNKWLVKQSFMKLSERLKFIIEMIGPCVDYQRILDTCCDHGQLGIYLAKNFPGIQIHLIDINKGIIERLGQKFSLPNVKIECLDAKDVVLSDEKNLVIIAGVGGELASTIIKTIIGNHQFKKQIDFLVVANTKNHLVRATFRNLGYKSFQEYLIFENKIAYECIFSKYNQGSDFDNIGKKMFDKKNEQHLNFLRKKHSFYQLKAKFNRDLQPLFNEFNCLFHDFIK